MKRRRRRRRKQMRITKWFQSLSKKKKIAIIAGGSVAAIVLCLAIAAVIYVASIFGKLDTQEIKKEDIVVNDLAEDVGEGYTNVVLFGGDSRTGEVSKNLNTDTIIIASLNNETKEVKLVSVYRDTLLDVTNGSIRKCNSAYSLGGATQAINMLNMNLDLDIQKYVTVDFGAVSELIDMLGGIEVDVSEAEYKAVNNYIEETAMVAGKKANKLTHAGLQNLDGVQATTYARIRKGVGDDYARTERQRLIIQKVFEKVLKTDLATIKKIINELFPRISTNFTMTEVLSYATYVTKYSIGETTGFPFDKGSGTIPGKGSCVYPVTLKSNVTKLHEFLYGTEDYEPSSKVASISAAVADVVGNRSADTNTTWTDTSGSTTNDDTNTGTDNGTGTGTGTDTETGTGTGTGAGTGTGTDTDAGTGTGTGTGGGNGEDNGNGEDKNPGSEPDIDEGTSEDENAGGGTGEDSGNSEDKNTGSGTGTDGGTSKDTGTDSSTGTTQ